MAGGVCLGWVGLAEGEGEACKEEHAIEGSFGVGATARLPASCGSALWCSGLAPPEDTPTHPPTHRPTHPHPATLFITTCRAINKVRLEKEQERLRARFEARRREEAEARGEAPPAPVSAADLPGYSRPKQQGIPKEAQEATA